jgi:hypothetical protein
MGSAYGLPKRFPLSCSDSEVRSRMYSNVPVWYSLAPVNREILSRLRIYSGSLINVYRIFLPQARFVQSGIP